MVTEQLSIVEGDTFKDNIERLLWVITRILNPIMAAIRIYEMEATENPGQMNWGSAVDSQAPHRLLGSVKSPEMKTLLEDLKFDIDKMSGFEKLISEDLKLCPI